jgi:hypothetical protein
MGAPFMLSAVTFTQSSLGFMLPCLATGDPVI